MAFMHLNDFTASEGRDLKSLGKAYSCCLKVLNLPVRVESLDLQFGAGIVGVATAYTKFVQV